MSGQLLELLNKEFATELDDMFEMHVDCIARELLEKSHNGQSMLIYNFGRIQERSEGYNCFLNVLDYFEEEGIGFRILKHGKHKNSDFFELYNVTVVFTWLN